MNDVSETEQDELKDDQFDAIIDNNLSKVRKYIGSGSYTALDLEPSEFIGLHGMICVREKPKNALQVAEFLNRKEILQYLNDSLTPLGQAQSTR